MRIFDNCVINYFARFTFKQSLIITLYHFLQIILKYSTSIRDGNHTDTVIFNVDKDN